MNPYHLLEHLYIGIIYITTMPTQSRCSRYMRGKLNMPNESVLKSRCKICLVMLVFLVGMYFSVTWINWDAAVIFHGPSKGDINIKTVEVDDQTLLSSKWKEKYSYVRDVFIESCTEGYDVLTNLNIKILGTRVTDSLVYICQEDKLFVNLRTNPSKSATRLVCNETYGDLWKVEDERYHPLEYSYVVHGDIKREEHNTTSYEETCMLYQADELLHGKWKPTSIKSTL